MKKWEKKVKMRKDKKNSMSYRWKNLEGTTKCCFKAKVGWSLIFVEREKLLQWEKIGEQVQGHRLWPQCRVTI